MVVIKSTVPVRTAELLGRADVSVVSNPEFLREGSVGRDLPAVLALGRGLRRRCRRGQDMIDRLAHHSEVISIKGDGYRVEDRDLGRVPPATRTND